VKVVVIGDAASINVRRWCDGLAGAGADITLVSFEDGATRSTPVRRIPGRWPSGPARYVAAGPVVRCMIQRLAPDVVVGYYVTGYGTLATLSGFHPRVQVTAGNDVLVNPSGTVTHFVATQNLRRADLVVAFAPHMAAAARSFGVDDARVVVMPRGVPVARFRVADRPADGDAVRVIATRALEHFYRHDVVLGALAATPGVLLTVAGTGVDRDEIEALARRLDVADRTDFVGYVDNDALPDVLARHHVYVSAAPSDGVSASLLEAMAAGLVPVVVDHPANREWVRHGDNGLLFAEGSSASLAAGLNRAASDRALQDRARAANPAIVRERADLAVNMRRYLDRFAALPTGRA
jgi:glycosyltransferase involved in cell wall biosynthesis